MAGLVAAAAAGALAGGAYTVGAAGPHGRSAAPPPVARPVPAPTTTYDFPPDGPVTPLDAASPVSTAPIAYTLSGHCHGSGQEYSCQVTVRASVGEVSRGAVVIDPDPARTQACSARAPVVGGRAHPAGTCRLPVSSFAFGYFTLGPPGPGDRPLATARLPFD